MYGDGPRRPLLFLDVDGVLLPFGARSGRPVRPALTRSGAANPLLERLDPDDGRRLLALGCPIVWATTWAGEGNDVIAPMLGLPAFPVVAWPDTDVELERGLHWKTAFLAQWSEGTPFIWLDDEITDVDRCWVAAHHPAPTLLHRVDPFIGLTADTFAAVERWLRHGLVD